jgi:imidazolonepropionase-like amidohydrolase
MRILTILLAASVATFASHTLTKSDSPTKAIRFGSLIDGNGHVTKDAVVIVDADRITKIGTGNGAVPKNADVIDLRPLTAIPGMIDLHTHMTYYWDPSSGTLPLKQPRRDPSLTAELSFQNAHKTLDTGVTTVRDLGSSGGADYMMRGGINDGTKVGPRMFVAGAGINEGRNGPDVVAMRNAVETRVKAGSDWIKVYASKGTYNSVDTTQTIGLEELTAIVEAAHAVGKPVAVHSYGAPGAHDAVFAGADSLEHGIEIDDATFKEMIKRGTVWVPTVDHNQYYVDSKDEYQFPDDTIPPLEDYIQKSFDATKRAVKLGVKIGMGSDAVYSMFGRNTRELSWMVKAGMTPAQALATATTTPAALLGHPKDLGQLGAGFYADIVAVDGNPLQDIDVAINKVKWVMKGGAVVVDKR